MILSGCRPVVSVLSLQALFDPEPILPLDVIMDAWSETRREEITGSSTICVASLNNETNQLNLSNIGDCGLMVLRHMDNETAGSYMRDQPRSQLWVVGVVPHRSWA